MKFLELYQKLKNESTPASFGQKILFYVKNDNQILDEINNFCNRIQGSENFTLQQKIWHFINNDTQLHKCPNCGKELDFVKLSVGYRQFCSQSCRAKFTQKRYWSNLTELEKENLLNKRNKKLQETLKQKYPNSNYINVSQTPEFRAKYEATCLKKYGNKFHMFSNAIREKIKKSNLEKYGVTCTLHYPETYEKTKKTNLKKYGFESHLQNIDIQKKIQDKSHKTKKYIYDNTTFITQGYGNLFLDFLKSINYKESFIKSEYNCPTFIYTTDKLHIYRPDFYLTDKNTIIEIKSEYTFFADFEKNIQKAKAVLSQGFTFIFVIYSKNSKNIICFSPIYNYKNQEFYFKIFTENDFNVKMFFDYHLYSKEQIVLSMIKNQFAKNTAKFFARKLQIDKISNNDLKIFLNENHLQGYTVSKYNYCLKDNDEIIAVMTFGNKRKFYKKDKNNENDKNKYELIRYCVKKDTTVVGGASKLLKYFIDQQNPDIIFSYANKMYSNGDLYKKLGFNKTIDTTPGYFYYKDDKIYHRFNFTKQKLVKMGYDKNKTENEIMENLGYFKFYDLGNFKFELKI